jgi:hypothetical protein
MNSAMISPIACMIRLPYSSALVTLGGLAMPPTGASSLS